MSLTKWWVRGLLIGALWGCQALPAAAEERMLCPICKKISEETVSYPEKIGNTLARGALNTGLGWTELIRQPATEVRRGGNVLVGLGKGVQHGLLRTASGLGELVTFWMPKVQDRYVHFSSDCPLDATE